jgi:hypothetical protein
LAEAWSEQQGPGESCAFLLGSRSGGLLGCLKERRALELPEAKGAECKKHDRL